MEEQEGNNGAQDYAENWQEADNESSRQTTGQAYGRANTAYDEQPRYRQRN